MSQATITLTSDITDDATSVIERCNLTKAGSGPTPLDQFTGENTIQNVTAKSAVPLIFADSGVPYNYAAT